MKTKNDFRIPLVKYGDIENCEAIGFKNLWLKPWNTKQIIRHLFSTIIMRSKTNFDFASTKRFL